MDASLRAAILEAQAVLVRLALTRPHGCPWRDWFFQMAALLADRAPVEPPVMTPRLELVPPTPD